MKLSVIFDDNRIVKDGVGYSVTLPNKPGIWAIQWNENKGHIEYRDSAKRNGLFEDEADLTEYVALWDAAHAEATKVEDPGEIVITQIHNKQARLQLLTMGILDQVELELEKLPEPNKSVALIEWKYADFFHRDHPLIGALAGIFGLTDDQVDQMFIAASKL
jgi:hypothetical protein